MTTSTPASIKQLPVIKAEAASLITTIEETRERIGLLDERLAGNTDTSDPAYQEREQLSIVLKDAETSYGERLAAIRETISETRATMRRNEARQEELRENGQIALAEAVLATQEIVALDELIGEDTDTTSPHYVERERLRRVRNEAQDKHHAVLAEMKSLMLETDEILKDLQSLPRDIAQPPAPSLVVKDESNVAVWWLFGGMIVGSGGVMIAIANGVFNSFLGL